MATIQQPSTQPSAIAEASGDSIVLRGISWELYEQLRDIPDNWGKRMTYDEGDLEIMSPSSKHEDFARLLARMLDAFTEELSIPIRGLRSTTWKSADRKRGLEADECYFVKNESRVRHLEEFDLARDPPPDIVIEVEMSRSAIRKLPLYAALGVPEVWRCSKGKVVFLHLSEDGQYVESQNSLNVPSLESSALNRFLAERATLDETAWIRAFRVWVRETFSNARP